MLKAFNQKEIKKFDKELTDGKGNWKPIRVSKDSFYLGGDVDKVKLFIHESHQRLIEEVRKEVNDFLQHAVIDYTNRPIEQRKGAFEELVDVRNGVYKLLSSLESSLENKE